MRLLGFLAVVLAATVVHPLSGGSVAHAQRARVPIPTQTYIGINPLGLPADIFTLEIENAVSSGVSVGGVGSYIDVDHWRYTTADFKVRYYPGEAVLRGFAVGVSAGVTRYSNDGAERTLIAPTAGILVDYNWLLGHSERFLIGTGIGAKRVLASESERQHANVDYATITTRLIFGFAF
jgi:hypothetical protein